MLRDLQKAFRDCYYQKEAHLLLKLRSSCHLSSEERFEIYANSITEGLIKALRESFPVTEKLVGETFFRYMAQVYINQEPSTSPNLGDFGSSLGDFVASFKAVQCLPYLADICHLEWCWQKAYYGIDHISLDVNKLTEIDPDCYPDLIFKLTANSSLLKSDYPLKAIWDYHQQEDLNEGLHLDKKNEYLIIWREKMEVTIDQLTLAEWLILTGFSQGLSLKHIVESLPSDLDLSSLISNIVLRGWINEVELS